MANYCSSDYCFVSSDREELNRLRTSLISAPHGKYGDTEMSDWFEHIGYKIPSGTDLRSGIVSVEDIAENEIDDGAHFYVTAEDAWCPKGEEYAAMLRVCFPNTTVYVRADEAGCDVFINTDPTGQFFPQQYRLDVCLPGRRPSDDGYACEDFNTEEDVLEYLAEEFDIQAASVDEANAIICDIVDDDDTGEAFGSIHQYR